MEDEDAVGEVGQHDDDQGAGDEPVERAADGSEQEGMKDDEDQDEVHGRVGEDHQCPERCERGVVDVRVDQEVPGDGQRSQRDDGGIGIAFPLARPVGVPAEPDGGGDGEQVARQIEHRGRSQVGADRPDREAVDVLEAIAADEADDSQGQQVPAGRVVRMLEADSDEDAGHGGHAHGLADDVTAGGARRARSTRRRHRPRSPGRSSTRAFSLPLPTSAAHLVFIGLFASLVESSVWGTALRPGASPLRTPGGYLHYPGKTMPTLVDKTKTVDLLRHEFESLDGIGSSVSDDQWDLATCLPGWSVRDVFSHVIGTESMLAGEPAPVVEISHLDHMTNAVAEGNELWVESMRSLRGPGLLDRFARDHRPAAGRARPDDPGRL